MLRLDHRRYATVRGRPGYGVDLSGPGRAADRRDAVAATAVQDFLEAACRWDLAEAEWLRTLIGAAGQAWGQPRFSFGFLYDASHDGSLRFGAPVWVHAGGPECSRHLEDALRRHAPAAVAGTYRDVPAGYGGPNGLVDGASARVLARVGAADVFFLNGLDGGGKGCLIGLGADRSVLAPQQASLLRRLAGHLAAAYRCRLRLLDPRPVPADDWNAPGLETLTARERQVVARVVAEKSTKEIARELGITPSTARVLLGRACQRLGVPSRRHLRNLPALRLMRAVSGPRPHGGAGAEHGPKRLDR
jgi:DNA-binding CsgD family transcriptional regulator